jgi:hypothetical protein
MHFLDVLESNQSFMPLQLIHFLVFNGRRSIFPIMSRYQLRRLLSREQLNIEDDTTLQNLTMLFTSNESEKDLM